MSKFNPLRQLPPAADYGPNDTLVVFGEVFSRGYVNGLIEEAERKGMKVVYTTVGRRDESTNELRPLTSEEMAEKKQSPLINVPLEAGFDMIPWSDGQTLVDKLSGYKMSEWDQVKVDRKELEDIIAKSRTDFQARVADMVKTLQKEVSMDGHIVFAHTMAGGIPRAKIIMPCLNKIFKGSGDRYQSSEEFWNTDLGYLCDRSFDEVTANTYQILIDATAELRNSKIQAGKKVAYVAYGYHGCDTYVESKDDYIWQSYSPYLQGWAKIKLENIASKAMENGIQAGVFNAPEILTNSSSVFLGIEVCLYPLLTALKKEGLNPDHPLFKESQSKLKPDYKLSDIEAYVQKYLNADTKDFESEFNKWPQHNQPEQMDRMKKASAELMDMHADSKNLCTAELSEIVFKACGGLMLDKSYNLEEPVWWMGHDIVSKWTAQRQNL